MDDHSRLDICYVEIERIKRNPYQPRRQFSKEELEELSSSIKELGLIHPPVVRPLPTGKEYELIAGERRLLASQLAGLSIIPVIVKKNSKLNQSAELALVENIQRVDLSPLDIAKALKQLAENSSLTQEEIARKIGKKRSTVANYFRLLTLPSSIQESIDKQLITMGHAKAILSLPDQNLKNELHKKIIEEALSVRQAEEVAGVLSKKKRPIAKKNKKEDLFLKDLARQLEEKIGTKIVITGQGCKGTLAIHFYSLDDLDRILAHLVEE